MAPKAKKADFTAAQLAVVSLSRDIISTRMAKRHVDIPHPHKGKPFLRAANRFVHTSNAIEKRFAPRIAQAAEKITTICDIGWEDDKNIVGLWHQLAEAITGFSEHPSKKVATLIIGATGQLQSFGINQVPPGIPKRSQHYIEGKRKEFIVCSERIALARFLGLKIKLPRFQNTPKNVQTIIIKEAIKNLTNRLIAEGQDSNDLNNSFLLTTTSPCEECAHAIAPFAPAAIITRNGNHGHLKRSASITKAHDYLIRKNIPFIYA